MGGGARCTCNGERTFSTRTLPLGHCPPGHYPPSLDITPLGHFPPRYGFCSRNLSVYILYAFKMLNYGPVFKFKALLKAGKEIYQIVSYILKRKMRNSSFHELSRPCTYILFGHLPPPPLQTFAFCIKYKQHNYYLNNHFIGYKCAWWMNNCIVRSCRDVIVVTKIATRRTSKAQSIVMY